MRKTLINLGWFLTIIIITAANIKPFSRKCKYSNKTSTCEEQNCQCNYTIGITGSHMVECANVVIDYIPQKYVTIDCNPLFGQFQSLPNISLGEFEKVILENCEDPRNTSLMSVLDRLGITNVRHLSLIYGRHKFSKENFKDFKSLIQLSISIYTLGFEVCEEINENMMNGIGIEDGAFDTLTGLQSLFIMIDKPHVITKATFKGLRSLQVLEMDTFYFITVDSDTFIYLENIKKIIMQRNQFHSLPQELFSSNRLLSEVKISRSKIRRLASELFANSPNLTSVDMSRNQISSLPEELFTNSTNVVTINFSENYVPILPETVFWDLVLLEKLELQSNALRSLEKYLLYNCRKIKFINLSHNHIVSIPRDFFRFAKDLIELRMSNNRLTTIDSQTFENQKNLQLVDMSNNKVEFEQREYRNIPFLNQHNMEHLILRNNSLKYISWDFSIYVMNQLKTLDLSLNSISYVDYSSIPYSRNGVEIDLSNNQIIEINFENYNENDATHRHFNGKPSLVNFNNNPLDCNCRAHFFVKFLQNHHPIQVFKFLNVDDLKCNQPERLKDRLVKNVNVMDLICDLKSLGVKNCKYRERLADSALFVDCSSQDLEFVPDFPEAYNPKYQLTILNIEDNRINELPSIHNSTGYSEVKEVFARGNNLSSILDYHIPDRLTHLDISKNNLQTLHDSAIEKLNSSEILELISLGDNPWRCDCSMRNLLIFLQDNQEKIANYSSLECSNGFFISKIAFESICPKDKQLIIILSIGLGVLGVLIGLSIAIYFKYQQEIKIWMYWNNILPFIFNSDVLDTDKKYDAFISYSHKDEDFVADQLIPELEQRQKFNLCIHKRDWVPGDFIPEQIVRSVSDSRRTIIILSPHFLESVWGTMEFRAAHRSAMEEQVFRVIVIIYGQVDKTTLDPELKSYLDMNTYIEWGDPWFWERLHFALRNIKTKKTKKREHLTISEDNNLELL